MSDEPLLSVRDLAVTFATEGGVVRAVDGVSFDIARGRSLGLVGESGSGKTMTAFAIMRLVPGPAGAIEAGEVRFEGRSLLTLPERAMRDVRGGRIGMVFQEPMTSLNPVYTAGFQIVEAIRLHRPLSRRDARARAIELLRRVGVGHPEERFDSYPHELSGGLRQRVMIAMALAGGPSLLIADEPTTALDMMTQANILGLLLELRETLGMTLLLVAHDLAVVGEVCDDVVVLYAGQVVERGPASSVLRAPGHPYTKALLASVPPLRPPARRRGEKGPRLPVIEGRPGDARERPTGCRFRDRCAVAIDLCARDMPELLPLARHRDDPAGESFVRCFVAEDAARDIARMGSPS